MSRRNMRSEVEALVKFHGSIKLLGVIDFTNISKTNAQATVPFGTSPFGLLGKILMLQSTKEVYVLPVNSKSGVVASITGLKLMTDEKFIMSMEDMEAGALPGETNQFIAAIRASANGFLNVYELV